MTRKVNQFVPSVHAEDAVGSTALIMDDLFTSLGFESEIYSLYRDSSLAGKVKVFRKESAPEVDEDINILHFALPSPLTEFFSHCGGSRILIYHNITPPRFFRGFQDELVDFTALGLSEIRSLADESIKPIAYSRFSAEDLRGIGFRDPVVLPFLLDWRRYRLQENPVLSKMLEDGWTNLLFVGRLVPNKKQDDLIRLLATCRANHADSRLRLILAGKGREGEKYLHELHRLIHRLSDPPVLFAGRVSPSELVSLYRHSQVFVSMSEHEGFGVPLIEAMHFDLPIVAYASSAVPDTLGGEGILVAHKDFDLTAAIIDRLLSDRQLRDAVIAGQRNRLKAFLPESALPIWEAYFKKI
jgi:L-malate glycosyltransferase